MTAARLIVPPAEDGLHPGIPDTVYHADHNSLSSSGARILLSECPAIFDHRRKEPPNPKPQYDFGHAAHKMVLGEGSQLVKVDATDWRTNAAKEKRAQAWADGKAPLLKAAIQEAQVMAGKVHANRYAQKLLSSGRAELSGYWRDEKTDTRLRFRPDWLTELPGGRPICIDYKTAVSANPEHFKKSALDYGYHCQDAWYRDGLIALGYEDPAFLFIVQMKTTPYLVSLIQLDAEYVELGRQRNRAAIDLYAQCAADDTWPDFGDTIHTVSLPPWAAAQLDSEPLAA